MTSLGARLKRAREKKGMTQIYVAEQLGISNGTLSGYERNYRDPDTDTLQRMADLYGVKVDWLLKGDNYKSDEKQTLISQKKKEAMDLIANAPEEDIDFIKEFLKRFTK